MQPLPTLQEISHRLADYPVFVILAETLSNWKPPTTDEGKEVLHKHYLWLLDLEKSGKLVLAGPANHDLVAAGKATGTGMPTGLIIIKAANRHDAGTIAAQDPFHTSGYRKNVVHALNIRFWGLNDVALQ